MAKLSPNLSKYQTGLIIHCNLRHSFNRYPVLSELAFGEKHGCFEKPSEKDPSKNVDCPEVLPLKYSEEPPFENAMVNDSPLVHPDSRSLTKYCLGTRLQMKNPKKSHKLQTCKYHDADNAEQGKFLKTMNQEALQVCILFSIV